MGQPRAARLRSLPPQRWVKAGSCSLRQDMPRRQRSRRRRVIDLLGSSLPTDEPCLTGLSGSEMEVRHAVRSDGEEVLARVWHKPYPYTRLQALAGESYASLQPLERNPRKRAACLGVALSPPPPSAQIGLIRRSASARVAGPSISTFASRCSRSDSLRRLSLRPRTVRSGLRSSCSKSNRQRIAR